MEKLFIELENILNNNELFRFVMKQQLNDYYQKFFGNKILNDLLDFTKLSLFNDGYYINFSKLNDLKNYKFWFCNDYKYTNKYFKNVYNKYELLNALANKNDIIINNKSFQDLNFFVIINILKNNYFEVYVDEDFSSNDFDLKNELNKYNIDFTIKKKLKINCILSSQRSGSTLLIDLLQKLSSNSLNLSEIFYSSTYKESYDCLKGVLKNQNIKSLEENNNNIQLYFKQFEDLAILMIMII